jgi:hypothetical protein
MKYFLTLLFLLPLLSLAQTKPQPDTIKIPTHAARQIAKDLVSCDSLKAVHTLAVQQLILTERKVDVQSNIIKSHEDKGIMYEQRIEAEQGKYKVMNDWVNDLRKQNKKLRVKITFMQIAGAAIGGILTYLYITK